MPPFVFLLAILFLVFHFDLKPVVGDEGVLAMDAWRIVQGQVPQRDFFEIIPPVAAYAQAAVFYLLGPSVLSLRLLGAIYGVALLVLAWIVARRYLKEPLYIALVIALLIPFGVGVWPFASHHWLADIFLLAALPVLDAGFGAFFTTKAQREGWGKKEAGVQQADRPRSFLGGGHGEETNLTAEAQSHGDGVLGVAGWAWRGRGQGGEKKIPPRFTLYPLHLTLRFPSVSPRLSGGLLAALGGALLALAALTLQDQGGYAIVGVMIATLAIPKGARLRLLAGLLAGIGTAVLVVVVPLAIKAGPLALFHDWLLFPLAQYHQVSANKVTLAQGFSQIFSQWDPQAFRVAPIYATTIALASMFVYLLPFLCLLALVLVWRRKWLSPCSLLLLASLSAAFLLAAWHRWSLMNLIWAAPMPMVSFAVAMEKTAASKRQGLALLSKGFAWALLICFVLFGLLRIRTASEKRRMHDVATPAGTYQTFSPVEASEIQGLVDAISDNVPKSAPLFCYGFDPLINFLTQHPNPTRYNFVLPGGYTSAQQMAQWEAALLNKDVQWGFGPNLPSEPPEPLGTFLRTNYDPVWNNSAFTLWKRRPHAG